MNLDPDTQIVLDMIRAANRPAWETLTPAEARVAYSASRAVLQPDPEDVAVLRDMVATGPAGDVPVRYYRPLERHQAHRNPSPLPLAGEVAERSEASEGAPDSGPHPALTRRPLPRSGRGDSETAELLPALVWFHGGGWMLGGLDSHDVICRRLANLARCAVVAVDYRMAPEHKFPAAVEDSATATAWVIDQAERLGIDKARVAVGGDSAGGNLAAVMALMARDGDLPPLAFQVLVYPATDMMMVTRSSQTMREGVPLTSATMKWFIDYYLPNDAAGLDWRASPLRAASLAGTAPALVLTASADPLCDEGLAYAERLEREGVRVKLLHLSDQVHGFLHMGRIIRAADVSMQMIAAVLRQVLAG